MPIQRLTAYIRTELLDAVQAALRDAGAPGISVSPSNGFGEYANYFAPDWRVEHARIEVYASSDRMEPLVETVLETAHTGYGGDGIVAVETVERLLKIRTGTPVEPSGP